MGPDLFNGVLQLGGACFVLVSIVKLSRDRLVRGISWLHATYFTLWGFWNLYYYPHLGQWFSLAGGAVLVATNTVWLIQLLYWSWREGQKRSLDEMRRLREMPHDLGVGGGSL